jgi:hypothetical protein
VLTCQHLMLLLGSCKSIHYLHHMSLARIWQHLWVTSAVLQVY